MKGLVVFEVNDEREQSSLFMQAPGQCQVREHEGQPSTSQEEGLPQTQICWLSALGPSHLQICEKSMSVD